MKNETKQAPKEVLIKCPYCGYEYLPCEIFYPDSLLGDAKNIRRDADGKIICYDNDSMNLQEEFTCEHCDHTFKVNLFVTAETEKNLFDDDFDFKINE